jgi:hypothetical protein
LRLVSGFYRASLGGFDSRSARTLGLCLCGHRLGSQSNRCAFSRLRLGFTSRLNIGLSYRRSLRLLGEGLLIRGECGFSDNRTKHRVRFGLSSTGSLGIDDGGSTHRIGFRLGGSSNLRVSNRRATQRIGFSLSAFGRAGMSDGCGLIVCRLLLLIKGKHRHDKGDNDYPDYTQPLSIHELHSY